MIPLGVLGASSSLSPAWTPGEIFSVPGTAGFWFDPYEASTLFQDKAGTTPVTSDGDPLGRIIDKSGNGLHAFQDSSGRRILWRTDGSRCWFEGVPSSLSNMQIGASYADTNFSILHMIARAQSATAGRGLVGKPHSMPQGSPWLRWALVHQVQDRLQTWFQGSQYFTGNGTWPKDADVTVEIDTSTGTLRVGTSTGSFPPTAITYPNNLPAYLMDDGNGNHFNGRCYGIVGVGRALTGNEASSLRAWMGAR